MFIFGAYSPIISMLTLIKGEIMKKLLSLVLLMCLSSISQAGGENAMSSGDHNHTRL